MFTRHPRYLYVNIPETTMHTKDKGDIAEIATVFNALKRGWSVSKPVGENQRYDLILDTGNNLLRVQCKTAKLENNIISASLTRMVRLATKYKRERYTEHEVDAFSLYCPETDKCYILYITDISTNGICQANVNLRTENSNFNNQHKVRLAKDYLL